MRRLFDGGILSLVMEFWFSSENYLLLVIWNQEFPIRRRKFFLSVKYFSVWERESSE